MLYTEKSAEPLYEELRPAAESAGVKLVECTVSRHKGSVQARLVIFNANGTGVKDCQVMHRAAEARLSLAYPSSSIYIEVSSAGIDRVLKDAAEFRYYEGLAVRCFVPEKSDWISGLVESASGESVTLKTPSGAVTLKYAEIAKAKLEN